MKNINFMSFLLKFALMRLPVTYVYLFSVGIFLSIFLHTVLVPYKASLHTVRHVTGNDKDYLRKIPRVVW